MKTADELRLGVHRVCVWRVMGGVIHYCVPCSSVKKTLVAQVLHYKKLAYGGPPPPAVRLRLQNGGERDLGLPWRKLDVAQKVCTCTTPDCHMTILSP